MTTLCGYELAEVRRSLRDAIGRRDRRASQRWAAELVATPGAIGSLWSALWLSCESSSTGNPTLPILLGQSWSSVSAKAHEYAGDWIGFRNDSAVRREVAEIIIRLLDYPRQTITLWPTKEVALYDVSTLKDNAPSAAADGRIVISVWNRQHDSMELRQMAGFWIEALQRGDVRIALSATFWTMMPTTELKCGPRGPKELSAKQRASPLWFWLSIGSAYMKSRTDLHPGWITMHETFIDAFMLHYKRWTATERLKILLLWILQIRATMVIQPASLWTIQAVQDMDIDLPYKEIIVEFSAAKAPEKKAEKKEKVEKIEPKSTAEEKLKQGNAQVMALLGISDE